MLPLVPVALIRLKHQLYTWREGDEAIGARANRRLLEAVLAHALDIVPGDDPAGARRQGPVKAHKIRPGLREAETDASGLRRLNGGDPLLEHLRRDAAVALERELHVV